MNAKQHQEKKIEEPVPLNDANQSRPSAKKPVKTKQARQLKLVPRLLVILFAAFFLTSLFLYMATPAAIRKPVFQHYHFRMQVIANGKTVNFGESQFQEGYSKDNCNVALTEHPIHFHDKRDQMVHIHWDGMTGGIVLKYYGWNYIGGMNQTIGYRFDHLPRISRVPVHGQVLPAVGEGNNFYVYTGDEKSHQQRSWDKFLRQDLEDFFHKKSNLGEGEQASLLNKLFPAASAHAGHDHTEDAADSQDLETINNLIGNVVIFAQKQPPSDAQVADRFSRLAPLDNSTCGG